MTQSEAGKQAQPALPEVTIWPCLMANQPAGCTHAHTYSVLSHTHTCTNSGLPGVPSLFVFVSQKLTCFGCKPQEASGRGTSKTVHTNTQENSDRYSQVPRMLLDLL